MKNKLFYLIGAAFLLCYTSTFTSCVNGVDDEYLDQKITDNGGTGKDDENAIPDINGDYSAEGDYDLKMTYNGYELGGKKVIVQADEKSETAMLTLAGTTKDLSVLNNLLQGLGATFTTYSPVPGEKEVVLKEVKLFRSGTDFVFDGEDIQPTYRLTYKGKIQNDIMTIDLTHMMTREENDILGAWKMGEVKEAGSGEGLLAQAELLNNNDNDPTKSSPLFLNWGSSVKVNMDRVPTGMEGALATIEVNRPMNGIFNLLMSQLVTSQLIEPSLEQALPKLLQYIATEETGGIYASYSYTGVEAPEYSQEMSHNLARYYFDKEDPKLLRIDIDADYLLTALGGMLNGVAARGTRAEAQPDNAKILAKELIDKLRPALEKGIPCEYVISGNDMTVNIEGKFLMDLLITIGKLVNDPFITYNIYPELDKIADLAPYKENIKLLLQNFPNALGEDCKYVKLGFRMVKTTPQD